MKKVLAFMFTALFFASCSNTPELTPDQQTRTDAEGLWQATCMNFEGGGSSKIQLQSEYGETYNTTVVTLEKYISAGCEIDNDYNVLYTMKFTTGHVTGETDTAEESTTYLGTGFKTNMEIVKIELLLVNKDLPGEAGTSILAGCGVTGPYENNEVYEITGCNLDPNFFDKGTMIYTTGFINSTKDTLYIGNWTGLDDPNNRTSLDSATDLYLEIIKQ